MVGKEEKSLGSFKARRSGKRMAKRHLKPVYLCMTITY
jgi:hypothetical protein